MCKRWRLSLCALALFALSFVDAAAPARRIVTLAPSLTELVYAAGAGAHLAGVESHSDYPPAARALPRIGDAFQVDYERILTLKPDLVLVWDTGTPEPTIERLRKMGLRVERIRIANLDEIAPAIRRIGDLAGTAAPAARAADDYQAELARLRAERARVTEVTVFYQISDKPLYTVSGQHPISEVIRLCGGRNIFADLKQLAPPVSMEAVLERDPQVILAGDDAPDPVSVWRQWPRMRAVQSGHLFVVDADLLARSTPRVLAGARAVCRLLDQVRDAQQPAGRSTGK